MSTVVQVINQGVHTPTTGTKINIQKCTCTLHTCTVHHVPDGTVFKIYKIIKIYFYVFNIYMCIHASHVPGTTLTQ